MSEVCRMVGRFGGFSKEDAEKYLAELEMKRLADEKKRLEEAARNAEVEKKVLDDLAKGDVYLPESKKIDYEASKFFFAEGKFDTCLKILSCKDARICSSEELFGRRLAQAHTNRGFQSKNVCDENIWTSECFYYFPDGRVYVALAERNLILKHPEEATECHEMKKEFFVDKYPLIKSQRGLEYLARKDPVEARKTGVLLLMGKTPLHQGPFKGRVAIQPTFDDICSLKLHKNRLGLFLGGENTRAYGKLCHSEEAEELRYFLADIKNAKLPFARPLRYFQVSSTDPAFLASECSLASSDLVNVLGVKPVYKGGSQ